MHFALAPFFALLRSAGVPKPMCTPRRGHGFGISLLQSAVSGYGNTRVDRSELLFVTADVLLQRLQQAFGVSGRQNHARNQFAKRRRMLLYEQVIENKFFFGMADIGHIRKGSLQNFGIKVYLDLVFVGQILRGIHAAQKRQAYCLTTTKKKHDGTMFSRFNRVLLPAFVGVLAVGCIERLPDNTERARFESEYGQVRVPARDQFVGSVYFATGSSALSKAAAADIGRMAQRIQERRNTGSRIVLIGYSDRRRGVEENTELAAERAQRVVMALEKRGVELERLVIDSRPVRSTKTTGERRVDIYVEKAGGSIFGSQALYPILVACFLLTTFVIAVIIFRRRR